MDLTGLKPSQRLQYIRIGERVGSLTVRDAAEVILKGCEQHAGALSTFGFTQAHTETLRALVSQYPTDLQARAQTQANKALTAATLQRVTAAGRRLRAEGRARLLVASLDLGLSEEALDVLERALDTTASLQDKADADALQAQLEVIRAALSQALRAASAQDVVLLERLRDGGAALAQARQAHNSQRTTAADTEQLNLLDGAVITHMRAANRVGKAAAKALGQPAIAHDLSLKALDR